MRTLQTSASLALALTVFAVSATQAPAAQRQTADQLDQKTLVAAYKQSIAEARAGRYLAASFGLLDQLHLTEASQIPDADVFDQWAQVMSCMTNRPSINPAAGVDFNVPPSQLTDLRDATAVPAIEEIVRRARHTRIVILDENHLDPRGRAFALDVARALRPLGYSVLAIEALRGVADDGEARARMASLAADKHARPSTGYYFDDPVFADFLRQSLALGYQPVNYETTRTNYSADPKVAQGQREKDQADALMRRTVTSFPKAKILIYVGEHHAAERPIAIEGGHVRMMADYLKEASGIDPLTIDQAGLSALPMNRPNVDLYAVAAPKAPRQSMVLLLHGKPLTVGLLAGSVDLQVVHPPVVLDHGRPTWLRSLGRTPSPVPQKLLPATGTRLVQAFLAADGDDTIPIDQVLVTAGKPAPWLMLPHAAIRYAVQDRP
ncbi:hypothetical protein [Dyella agri]|uniref:Haem-binding uptake Tiki superfamily ChaN domain-containing protein n=1 Tax=Dyella agri TaxID=1926869 RepID=A0ABW8KI74_9GAMM